MTDAAAPNEPPFDGQPVAPGDPDRPPSPEPAPAQPDEDPDVQKERQGESE